MPDMLKAVCAYACVCVCVCVSRGNTDKIDNHDEKNETKLTNDFSQDE